MPAQLAEGYLVKTKPINAKMEPCIPNEALGNPLVLLRHLKVRVMQNIRLMKGKLESDDPISFVEMRADLGYLDNAWGEFVFQYNMVSQFASRGRLFGLEACYSELHKQYWGYGWGWERILAEEQAKPKPDCVYKPALEDAIRE